MAIEMKSVADHEPCGCMGLGHAIYFCPLHAAAPDLLAACEAVNQWFEEIKAGHYDKVVHQQTPESASGNWDHISTKEFDMAPLKAAIERARRET